MICWTESYCDIAFENPGVVIARAWGPDLKVTEWSGKPMQGIDGHEYPVRDSLMKHMGRKDLSVFLVKSLT